MTAVTLWVTGPMVYLALAVLAVGLGYRLHQWGATPVSPMQLGIYPQPKAGTRGFRVLLDTLACPQVAEVNPGLWLAALLFHLALLGVFAGHLHLLGRFPGALEAQLTAGAGPIGGTLGIVWLAAALYLLLRRFQSPYRELSTPEDYLLLLLVIGVVGFGDYLRFFVHVEVGVHQQWVRSLLAFRPALPVELATPPARWPFTAHVLFANLLLMYVPFSKLTHFVGAFLTNRIRRG